MGLGRLGAALLAAASGPARAEGPLELQAELVEVQGGVATAEGGVKVEVAGVALGAEGARLDAEGLTLSAPVGVLGGYPIEAAQLTWFAVTNELQLQHVRINPCGGCPPAWTLEAREASATAEGALLRGVVLRLGPAPVLWAPRLGVGAQAPRLRPGLPRVGRGPDGLQVAMPLVWQGARGPRLTLTPEWRMARGWFSELAVEADEDALRLAGGFDTQERAWRGAIEGQAARAGPGWTLAAEGMLVSDGRWLGHFPEDILVRSAPWTTTRALAAWGPLSLAWRGWQQGPEAPMVGVPSLLLADGLRLGPARLDGRARLDLLEGLPSAELAARAASLHTLGPLELGLLGEGRAQPGGAEGRAELDLAFPLWADHGRLRHELVPSARAGTGGALGRWPEATALPPALPDALGVAWMGAPVGVVPGLPTLAVGPWAGPALRSSWWGADARLDLDLLGQAAAQGVAGAGRLGLRWRGLTWALDGALGVEAWRASTRVGWEGEQLSAELGAVATDGAQQLVGRFGLRLPGARGRWLPGVEAVARPDALASAAAGLTWVAEGGCLELGGRVGFAEDREGPQLALSLRLTPQPLSATGP